MMLPYPLRSDIPLFHPSKGNILFWSSRFLPLHQLLSHPLFLYTSSIPTILYFIQPSHLSSSLPFFFSISSHYFYFLPFCIVFFPSLFLCFIFFFVFSVYFLFFNPSLAIFLDPLPPILSPPRALRPPVCLLPCRLLPC